MRSFQSFISGSITYEFPGACNIRIMNLCRNRQIPIQNITEKDGRLFLTIPAGEQVKFHTVLDKVDTKAVISKQYGLPFLFRKMINKPVFTVGICAALLLVALNTQFIRNIEFEGNTRFADSTISDYLYTLQIYCGMPACKLDLELLEQRIREDIPYISWVSCRRKGTTLLISVKETDSEPVGQDDKDQTGQYNIYSLCDGIVSDIVVRNGFAKVKEGDSVTKNQLLVEGIVPIYNDDGTVRFLTATKADADILLSYSESIVFTQAKVIMEPLYTGRENTEYSFAFLGNTYRLKGNPFVQSVDMAVQMLPDRIFCFELPFCLLRTARYEQYKLERLISREEAIQNLKAEYSRYLKSLRENGAKVIEKNVEIEDNEKEYLMRVDLSLLGSKVRSERVENNTEN